MAIDLKAGLGNVAAGGNSSAASTDTAAKKVTEAKKATERFCFRSIKPNMNIHVPGEHDSVTKHAFRNHFFETDDARVAAYIEKEFKAFCEKVTPAAKDKAWRVSDTNTVDESSGPIRDILKPEAKG